MDQQTELGYKVRQILNHGTANLDNAIERRLHAARQAALQHQRVAVRGLQLAGIGHFFAESVLHHARGILAALALVVGASGTYLWHQYEQAAENEEVDSALLADDLPPAAYLDHGFRAWLERSSHSSQ
jgi:phosphatidylserine/phosphatidylglycerophosphate/cardiolipin synthase-like enzyme